MRQNRESRRDRWARCPRCGYDLRGAVSAWETACPLTGTCTECGLALNWAEVLCPAKFEPQWCVEFIRRRRRFPTAAVITFARSWWPFGFWSAMRMSMAIRSRRLLLYVGALFLPILFGYVSIQTTIAARTRYQVQQSIVDYRRELQQQLTQYQQWLASPESRPYGVASTGRLRLAVQQMQAEVNAAAGVNHSYTAAVVEAVFTPWAATSAGTITWPGATGPYPAPRELYGMRLTYSAGRGLDWPEINASERRVVLAAWLWLLLPVSFVLLPVSRRRAKVRWAHLVRVTAYGSFVFFSLAFASLLLAGVGLMWQGGQAGLFATAHLVWRWVPIPMLMVWWWAATSRYLCLPHGCAVVGLLSLLCALLFIAAGIFLVPWLLFNYW